jgi:hypothetical protein
MALILAISALLFSEITLKSIVLFLSLNTNFVFTFESELFVLALDE